MRASANRTQMAADTTTQHSYEMQQVGRGHPIIDIYYIPLSIHAQSQRFNDGSESVESTPWAIARLAVVGNFYLAQC